MPETQQVSKASELAAIQRAVLGHEGLGLTEIRDIKRGQSKYVRDTAGFCGAVQDKSDIYVGINPRAVEDGSGKSVSHVTCLVIDIDPVRGRGEPSTDVQHLEACEIGKRIVNDFPGSLAVSSGSGCHAYFPISPVQVVNPKALTNSVKAWTLAMKAKYETPTQKIDHIFDLPRVIRVWGTHNTKSNRTCQPITEIPAGRFTVPLSQVDTLVPSHSTQNPAEVDIRFERLLLTSAPLRAIVAGTATFESRSEADYSFIAQLAKAHFSQAEIAHLLPRNPLGKATDRSPESVSKDVERVIDKLNSNAEIESYSLVHQGSRYKTGLQNRRMGLKTGLPMFDETISGLKPQKVYLTAARPTNGKTTIMTQWLDHLVSVEHQVALCFPTEVGAEPIIDKIVCSRSGVNLKKFQNGDFNSEEAERIAKTVEKIQGLPLVVVEDFGLTVEKIEAKMREVAPTVVAIDYINAMKFPNGGEPSEMAGAVRKIKELAGDYNVPVLLFAQLRRGDGKLDLSALKGTGSLEELCDVVSFLYGIGDRLDYPTKSILEVMKSKYSATGCIGLDFYRSTCQFKENQHE